MKKLLLVVLVPILVLGFMGCGKVFDNVDPLPDALLGQWIKEADEVGSEYKLDIAGSHASVVFVPTGTYNPDGANQPDRVVTISFRLGYSGANPINNNSQFTIEFYDFLAKKNNLWGTITGKLEGGNLVVISSEAEDYKYLIPPVGTYAPQ